MWVLKKRRKKHLGGKLSTETLRDEDGIGVHEMAKTLLRAIYEYCFHGSLSRNVRFFFSSLREKQELNWTNTRVTEWGVFWVSGFSILYLVWFKLGAARVHLSFLKFGHVTWHRSMRCVLRNDAPLVSLSTVESAGWTDNGGWRNSISRFLIINENKKKRKKWINNKPGPQTTTSQRRVSQG